MSETATARPGAVTIETRTLAVSWADGSEGAYPFAWLRDSCACSSCRDTGSGQRLLEPAAIPHDLRPAEAHLDGDDLLVAWAPEGRPALEAGLRSQSRMAPTTPS